MGFLSGLTPINPKRGVTHEQREVAEQAIAFERDENQLVPIRGSRQRAASWSKALQERLPLSGVWSTRADDSDKHRSTDIAIFGLQVILHYAPKEILCPTHGRIQEEILWAAIRARVTYRLEYRVCALSQIMTQKAASEILRMASSADRAQDSRAGYPRRRRDLLL
jgi:hypothetical protein